MNKLFFLVASVFPFFAAQPPASPVSGLAAGICAMSLESATESAPAYENTCHTSNLPVFVAQSPSSLVGLHPRVDESPLYVYTVACTNQGLMANIHYLEAHRIHGPIINTQENRDANLRYAIGSDLDEVVAHLLHKGANPNAKTITSLITTLHSASLFGKEKYVEWLRIFGGDPNIEGDFNTYCTETPLETVQKMIWHHPHQDPTKYQRIIALLQKPASDFANRKHEVKP